MPTYKIIKDGVKLSKKINNKCKNNAYSKL